MTPPVDTPARFKALNSLMAVFGFALYTACLITIPFSEGPMIPCMFFIAATIWHASNLFLAQLERLRRMP